MSGSSIQAEGDPDGGDDKDPQGDGGHVEVENENVIDVGTSFRSSTEHSTNGNDDLELTVAPNLYPLSSKADRMPVMTLPSPNIPLHSPSNTIIGTPFATDSTPYEYPFPDHCTTTNRPFSSSLTNLSPSSSFPSLSSSSSFAMASSSSPQLPSLSTTPPTISPLAHFLPDLSQKYSHPKLRQGNPPVPPALIKKRQRWSLGLLHRRSSSGSSSSVGPLSSSEALSDTASERVSKPLRVTGVTQEVVRNNSQRQTKIVREEENTKVQPLD